jgi:GTP cyclohydrolase I
MAPIARIAGIAYLANNHVVGISKLARGPQGFARWLQIQERLTAEVAECNWTRRHPLGVAAVIKATHACVTARGVRTPGAEMTASRMIGMFREDERSHKEVLYILGWFR